MQARIASSADIYGGTSHVINSAELCLVDQQEEYKIADW